MKKTKKLLALLLAALLVCGIPTAALAATWDDVDTWDKLETAFGDTDADVVINITADIELLDILTANIGQTYTINGHTFVLSNVYLDGAGTVTINADITDTEGSSEDALHVYEDVNVTVNGDITSTTANDAVETDDNAQVTVNGNISAVEGDGVDTNDNSQVTVNGNVSSVENEAVYTNENSQVTVNGNVSSVEEEAVYTNENSQVTVNGNVSSVEEEAIYTNEESQVTVTGDVNGSVYADESSQVTVEGSVTGTSGTVDDEGNLDRGTMSDPSGYSDGSAGVYAEDSAIVTVTGDVTGGDAYGTYGYAGGGVVADGAATVTVGGNVTGGSVTANPDVEADGYAVSEAGHGVYMDSTATVKVGGDVTGGSTNGDKGLAGTGVTIVLEMVERGVDPVEPGSLTVEGTVTGGSGSENASALFLKYTGNYNFEQYPTEDLIFETIGALDALREGRGEGLGMTAEEVQDYCLEHFNALDAIILDATGEHLNSTTGGIEAAADAINTLPEENRVAYRQQIIDLMKAMSDDFFTPAEAPEITVWGLTVAEGAELIGSENLDSAVKDVIAADVNYIIRTAAAKGGSVTADKETAKAGETITITPKADEGYELARVLVSGKEITPVDGVYTFVVPEGGLVEVSAEFTQIVKTSSGPETGDNSNMLLWAVLMLVSGTGIAGITVCSMRKKQNDVK